MTDRETTVLGTSFVSTGHVWIACGSGRHNAVIMAREVVKYLRTYGIKANLKHIGGMFSGATSLRGEKDMRGLCGCHLDPMYC
eukprot:6339978-Karenia_brevis.AAC.1